VTLCNVILVSIGLRTVTMPLVTAFSPASTTGNG
jgi:hypothetical protein